MLSIMRRWLLHYSGKQNPVTFSVTVSKHGLILLFLLKQNLVLIKRLRSTPQRIRTSNLRFRRPMLYPIELGVLFKVVSCRNSSQLITNSLKSLPFKSLELIKDFLSRKTYYGEKSRLTQESQVHSQRLNQEKQPQRLFLMALMARKSFHLFNLRDKTSL